MKDSRHKHELTYDNLVNDKNKQSKNVFKKKEKKKTIIWHNRPNL